MNDEAVYRTAPATPGLLIIPNTKKNYFTGQAIQEYCVCFNLLLSNM